MATPRPAGDGWNGPGQPTNNHPPPHAADANGPQVRPMGLKVHYTFDKEAKVNCLARYPHTMQVQTIPLDETTSIGVVDLRACLQAVIECSPELVGQEGDYTIYAVDYSEPDTPLVGHGMLSWALDSMRPDAPPSPPKLVIGRVTRPLLTVFGGGNRETLEVRIKFSETARLYRNFRHSSVDFPQNRPLEQPPAERPPESAPTPSGSSEWTSFVQSNPHIGQPARVSRVSSPALSQGPQGPSTQNTEPLGPPVPPQQSLTPVTQEAHRVAPTPVEPAEQPRLVAAPPSRPPSQASTVARKRGPTGRPRGRPRKRPVDDHTSGCEEATEAEDGPTKKRAKAVKADKSAANPFASGPESLRVAASTSGSLRNFRPVTASNNEGPSGSRLQELPRAPTPTPEAGPFAGRLRRGPNQPKPRLESALAQNQVAAYSESRLQPLSPGQEDGRSPESPVPTPAFSEASMSSSPPVQRPTPFMRSSPPPSSPVLPPMPSTELQHDDAPFGNDDIDDLFGEPLAQPTPHDAVPSRPRVPRTTAPKKSQGVPMQVFQMQDGPQGQDMVYICSYNGAPQPTTSGANPQQIPVSGGVPSLLPALPKQKDVSPQGKAPAMKQLSAATTVHTPMMEPTPPPTTDTAERPTSPVPATEPTHEHLPPCSVPAVDPMQGVKQSEDMNIPTSGLSPPSTETTKPDDTATQQDSESSTKQSKKKITPAAKPKTARPLVRSQSTGAVALALPSVPASEPVGPSSLSLSSTAEPSQPTPPAPSGLKRAASSGPLALPIPASDPVGPSFSALQPSNQEQPEVSVPPSDAVPPPSDAAPPPSDAVPAPSSPPPQRSNKNRVKKHAIKQRLEEAIMNGEMPPFCSNCGAIETPTWRKIWVQDREGTPEYFEYSEKPGRVTAIEIMKRDADEKPTSYRLIKKSLGADDDRTAWHELLLCNPCGIWLTKCKCHRPSDRWDKDFSRIGQERRRKVPAGTNPPRPRKPRPKNDAPINPTSEAYLATDALGPVEPSSPKATDGGPPQRTAAGPLGEHDQPLETRPPSADAGDGDDGNAVCSRAGSTQSRGSGTAQSPVELDFDEAVGSTKRLLFPSPRKDGVPKVLGETAVNVVQVSDEFQQLKRLAKDKENDGAQAVDGARSDGDGTEPPRTSPAAARPSTPPPTTRGNDAPGPFKTPTRATPSHRPVTRSVSRSLRSVRSVATPVQALLQRTPTKTPRGGLGITGSVGPRRSPRNPQGGFEEFDTPISRTISQMFSDPANFGLVEDLDLSSLPPLEASANNLIDFGNLLSTDAAMPSSPPKDFSIGFDYRGSADVWAQWTLEHSGSMQLDEEE
ncbi:hypothetical protein CDD83_10838 [Cordyceps sp. RAO-2017]|nr:hypothetical protein CDD83_10838 [Cordyceps sp. RAO-2017]